MSESRDRRTVLSAADIETEGLGDWRIMFDTLHGRFETGDFATGVRLVGAIGAAADELNHHPDVELTYPRVDIRLTSHDVDGITIRDVVLARTISELAANLDATPRPEQISMLELALDTPDREEIKPFWAALLGYRVGDHEIRDADGTMPTIWFQTSEPHETPHQRWHLDLRVPPDTVQARIEQALAAGGTLVSDVDAPAYWVLVDSQGNRACLTTWQGRDSE